MLRDDRLARVTVKSVRIERAKALTTRPAPSQVPLVSRQEQ